MDIEKFEEDISTLLKRISTNEDIRVKYELEKVSNRLVKLYRRNLVKINHSVMELLCAKHLILKGYYVEVEHQLSDTLVCDLFGVRGEGKLIIEIETGYTPPEHALDPLTYNRARIVSKIARYSTFSDKFGLGTLPTNILQIPEFFQKPPSYREDNEILEIKALCDKYYKKPPVSFDEIKNARLHAIYIIDVDEALVREIDPEAYIDEVLKIPFVKKEFLG
ncbi:MAG: hypothetical protein QXL52_02080 [Nitrososphaerales archaeon]